MKDLCYNVKYQYLETYEDEQNRRTSVLGKRIIVLGAGYAGVLTAKKLAKRLKKQDDVKITLIDRNTYHTMLTEIHEVAADRVDEDHVRVSLKRIFAGRGVELITDNITEVDYTNKTLTGQNGCHPFDYLVLATGSRPTFFGTKGAEEHAFQIWSYEDALKLKAHILAVFRRAASETDENIKRRLLTFFVVGAGFTGVEMVGELAEWVPILCDRFEIDRGFVRVVNVDMLDRVVPTFPEKLSAKAERRLAKMGVEVRLKAGVSAVGEDFIEYKYNGETIRDATSTVIWSAGVEESPLTASDSLKRMGRGRVQTDDYLRAEGHEDVYVAGDNIYYVPERQGVPVPQMVENCEMSADTVAYNLAAAVTGQGEMEKYDPAFHGAMLSIGGRYGIANVGTDKKQFAMPSFISMFIKHFIYLIYFVQILGWNKVFSYLKHEFFTIRHCRSFLGGHFSNRSPSFFLVPLRIFLGGYWIYEAVDKISQGWLSSPKLADYFSGAAAVFAQIAGTGGADAASGATAAATAADAASGATQAASAAAASAGSLLLNWNILGLFRILIVKTSDIAIKINCGMMDWFNHTFVTAGDGTQMFFQVFIVLSELLLGALLVAGLFTTISSAFSLGLETMFVMSTGMYMSTWWMVFAAIALLFGGGQALGLDYYFMPWLKKHWKNVRWVRKSYLYHD